MNFLRFSVVTPSFNQGNYIDDTIRSVLTQNWPNLEYRVMDGGSNDNTIQILKSYGSEIIWESAPDTGQANAINKGWRQSSGDIMAWINADDLYRPETFSTVANFFNQNPKIDIVYGDCSLISEHGNAVGKYQTHSFDYIDFITSAHNYIPQPATFIRQDVIKKTGYLNEVLHYTMDLDYWLRAGFNHQVAYLPDTLAELRIHDQAKSSANLVEFSSELIYVYENFFQRPDLPKKIHTHRSVAMSNISYRAADCAFWGNNLAKARRYAWQSWLYKPLRIRRLWLYLLLGNLGRVLADRTMSNPYRIRS